MAARHTGPRAGAAAPDAEAPIGETIGAGDNALQVEGTDTAAVAAAEAIAAKEMPAAGQGQVAEALAGPAIATERVVDAGDADPLNPIRDGSTIRSFDVPARPTLDGEDLRPRRAERGGEVLLGAIARRAGRNEILPLSAPAIDPERVPGRKVVTAATQVRHDGRTFLPGETFPVDFRAHSELVPIGAVVATPWHELPDEEED